jgi:hypothetical protein
MTLTLQDRATITELIALHGHLCDSGELDRLGEVFTTDVGYDVTDLGHEVLRGVAACAEAAWALGDLNPVGHHVTNTVLTEDAAGRVHALSKGIGVSADGSSASVTYEDTLVRLPQGWRISYRKIRARRAPLGA